MTNWVWRDVGLVLLGLILLARGARVEQPERESDRPHADLLE